MLRNTHFCRVSSTKSVECLVDGSDPQNDTKQKVSAKDTFCVYKILRNKPRHRAIVIVGIGHIVGVELQLVVIEVEDRSLREHAIGIRSFTTFHLYHKPRNMILHMNHNSVFNLTTQLLACRKKW
jgi:hypothetical protein